MRLGSIAGREHIIEAPDLLVDGTAPALLVKPGSAEDVARCLGVCAELSAAVIPAGLMSWLDCGNPVRRADVVLSTERMNRVIDYSPPDLTATVEAGVTLEAFNAVARREGQWLPLDPPGSARSSLGAIGACSSSGSLRVRFGTPRDYVIGLRLAHADGSESRAGGKVVKNVAGYDMSKLYVGSFGTLAVLTELTFKLRPLAECDSTVIVTSNQRQSLLDLSADLLASELQPASLFITNLEINRTPGGVADGHTLLVRFVDSEPAVRYQRDVLGAMVASGSAAILSESDATRVWDQFGNIDRLAATAVRVSVPLSAASRFYERACLRTPSCVAAGDLGTGIIRLAFDADPQSAIDIIKSIRAESQSAAGHLFIERAEAVVKKGAEAWGEVGETAEIMKSIKARLDPKGLLNPGRFVAGI